MFSYLVIFCLVQVNLNGIEAVPQFGGIQSRSSGQSQFGEGIRDWFSNLRDRAYGISPDVSTLINTETDRVEQRRETVHNTFSDFQLDLTKLMFDPNRDWGFRIGSWYFIKKSDHSGPDETYLTRPVPERNPFGTDNYNKPIWTTPMTTTPRTAGTTPSFLSTTTPAFLTSSSSTGLPSSSTAIPSETIEVTTEVLNEKTDGENIVENKNEENPVENNSAEVILPQ